MTIETVGVVISIIVAIVGLIINIAAVGIYIGRLDGFKDLVNFKFDQQDKKLEKHNNFITRIYDLERKDGIREEQIKVANNRIKDLEEFVEAK